MIGLIDWHSTRFRSRKGIRRQQRQISQSTSVRRRAKNRGSVLAVGTVLAMGIGAVDPN